MSILQFTRSSSSASASNMQHYARVKPQYLYVIQHYIYVIYSSQTGCLTPYKNDHDNQWYSFPPLWVFISKIRGFFFFPGMQCIYLRFVMMNLACIMIRTQNVLMRIWSVIMVQEMSLTLFSDCDNLHSSYIQAVKTSRVRWLEEAESVCGSHRAD